MTIRCGICDKEIPSHMVERRRGSHYTEHYENVEEILHEDLGKILEVSTTDELNKKFNEVQIQKEQYIVGKSYDKSFKIFPYHIGNSDLLSIKNLKDLRNKIDSVISDAEENKITIKSVDKLGRHTNWHWNRLHIPEIDVCKDCFSKFNHPKITLGYLDRSVPQLKLQELNKDIWNDVSKCSVEIKLTEN